MCYTVARDTACQPPVPVRQDLENICGTLAPLTNAHTDAPCEESLRGGWASDHCNRGSVFPREFSPHAF